MFEAPFFFRRKYQARDLEGIFEATHENTGLLSRKQVCPKANEWKERAFLESSRENWDSPKGQNTSDTEAFRGNPTKGLCRDEFSRRIFLHKSQVRAIFEAIKRKGGKNLRKKETPK